MSQPGRAPQEIANQANVSANPNTTGGEERVWNMWIAQAERHLR